MSEFRSKKKNYPKPVIKIDFKQQTKAVIK